MLIKALLSAMGYSKEEFEKTVKGGYAEYQALVKRAEKLEYELGECRRMLQKLTGEDLSTLAIASSEVATDIPSQTV